MRCNKQASFGLVGQLATFCAQHKEQNCVDVLNRRCQSFGCNTHPSFGLPGGTSKNALFCAQHKHAEHVNVVVKRCKAPGCFIKPTFGVSGGSYGDAQFCADHKQAHHVNLVSKRCPIPGCNTIASFGIPGSGKQFCGKHKQNGCINLVAKRCQSSGCSTSARFGVAGGSAKDAMFCAKHKHENHVNIEEKRCQSHGCTQRPSFGLVGETPVFCSQHRHPNHVNLTGSRCKSAGCTKIPCFGALGGKPMFCLQHKHVDHVNVSRKRCETKGCRQAAVFGVAGDRQKFCAVHKNVDHVDLVHPRCQASGCTTQPKFGVPGQRPSLCGRHMDRRAHIKRSNAKCLRCHEPATHGRNHQLFHCEAHASHDEIDLVQRRCIGCGLLSILNHAEKCYFCDDQVKERCFLVKQKELMQHLDAHGFPGISTDRPVDGAVCGKERPDRLFESKAGDLFIILECDEHQHKDRSVDCERVRMLNLSQSFGGTPVLFVRWNPDSYRPGGGPAGSKQASIAKRYSTLCSVLKQYIETPRDQLQITGLCSVISLFFDHYTGVLPPKLVE